MIGRCVVLASIVSCFVAPVWSAPPVQPYPLQWQATYDRTNSDGGSRVVLAPDGGYLLAGASDSDGWLVRIDAKGNKLWERNYGGTGAEGIRDIKRTLDDGWVIAVESNSDPSGNKTSPNFGGHSHYWILRLDANGNILWQKSFGGGYFTDIPETVLVLPDGGFLVGGTSQSYTNEIKTLPQFTDDLPYGDYWLLKLDPAGEIVWQRVYGGNYTEWFKAAELWGTNGYILAGSSMSPPSGNKESALYGSHDFWIILVDLDGNKIWEKSYGGDDFEDLFEVRCTKDGGFVLCGWTLSGVSGNKTTPLVGAGYDGWIVRLNSQGEKMWERTFGTPLVDDPLALEHTPDGGFIVGGIVDWQDAWFVRLNSEGDLVWEQTFQLGNTTLISDIQNTLDGGIIAIGGVITGSRGDMVVMKFGPDRMTAPHLEITPQADRLLLSGIAGRTYVVESSPELANWTPYATNTLVSNSAALPNLDRTFTNRFYRARMVD